MSEQLPARRSSSDPERGSGRPNRPGKVIRLGESSRPEVYRDLDPDGVDGKAIHFHGDVHNHNHYHAPANLPAAKEEPKQAPAQVQQVIVEYRRDPYWYPYYCPWWSFDGGFLIVMFMFFGFIAFLVLMVMMAIGFRSNAPAAPTTIIVTSAVAEAEVEEEGPGPRSFEEYLVSDRGEKRHRRVAH